MGDDDNDSIDTFKTYARSPGILWRGWTMPANQNLIASYPAVDRWAARQAGIFVIVFLMLCLKGSPTTGSLISSLAGSVLTYILNLWVESKEPKLISAYGIMIAVLLLTLVLPVFLGNTVPYIWLEELLKDTGIYGLSTFVPPIAFATIIAFMLWYMKARFVDGNSVDRVTAGWAATTATIAGLIVLAVDYLPKGVLTVSTPGA